MSSSTSSSERRVFLKIFLAITLGMAVSLVPVRVLTYLNDATAETILARVDGIRINGDMEHRIPGNLNLSFVGIQAEDLMAGLKDLAVSSGSACTSESVEPSYVLRALGLSDELATASIRIGLGRFTTEQEIDFAAETIAVEVERLRRVKSLGQTSAA